MSRGKQHVLALIDGFTKYVLIYTEKTNDTNAVKDSFLKKVSPFFNVPKFVVSDRGTAFTAKNFERFCED